MQLGLVGEQHRLGVGEQVGGDQRQLDPDGVDVFVSGRQVAQAGVLTGSDAVLDPGVRTMSGFQQRGLPAAGVGGERLVAVAIADLEGVQRRAGVWQLAAHDDPHPGAGGVPATQVEQAGDLHDVGVLTQATVGVARALPGPGRHRGDRLADSFSDGEADREVQPLSRHRGDQGVGVARAVSPDQDRDVRVTPSVW